jgi:phage terminase small subunit
MVADMNTRQTKFIQQYLLTGNATQAAISAGYARSGAAVHGVRLLKNDKIRTAIASAQQKTAEKFERTHVEVLKNIDAIGQDARKAGVYAPALKAEQLIGMHLGMWPTRVEHTGKDGAPIKTEQTVTLDASKLDAEARALLREALKAAKE